MTIDFTLPKHAIRAKDLMYLQMPTLERTYPEVALDSRRYPIQYMTTEERNLTINLKLPEGFRLKWAPPPLRFSTPHLEYEAVYKETDGVITLTKSFKRLGRIVPAEAYPEYRDALRAIAAFSTKEIFVQLSANSAHLHERTPLLLDNVAPEDKESSPKPRVPRGSPPPKGDRRDESGASVLGVLCPPLAGVATREARGRGWNIDVTEFCCGYAAL
jgi:hypothetical protein